jgi:hypothetical protein
MIDTETTFVLGAQDPEMREIAKVLKRQNRAFVHAAKKKMPVSTRNAYSADSVMCLTRSGRGEPALLLPQAPAVFVECTLGAREPVLRIEHHNPGDPGYAIAAGALSLTAAYQGRCPGVDPHELLFLRASWRAKMSGRSLTDVIDGILAAAKEVRRYYDSEYNESLFLDPTEMPPELPEAGAYVGRPVRYRAFFPNGDLKEMLKGAAPQHIERFMAAHRDQGREVYGNPYRGYAGAYL